jgi:eukaryotic-like serine/threonine-protein kinase
MYGRYLASGHLVFMRAESMVAAPFDPERRTITGGAVALSEKVATTTQNGVAQIDVAANGTMVYVPDLPGSNETEVVWLDRKGTISPALPIRRRFNDAAISPDGTRVALSIDERTRDLWIYDFTRGLLTRVTSGPANNFGAMWSADGRQLLYVSERPVFNIYRKTAAAGAPEEPFVAEP